MLKKLTALTLTAVVLSVAAAQCGAPATVVVTKEVEKVVTKEVEKVVTKEVEKIVTKEVVRLVMPEPITGSVAAAFTTSSDPTGLAPWWSWHPGRSYLSTYRLGGEAGRLTLVAGPGTDQWEEEESLPYVSLDLMGDFEAQVELRFSPTQRWQTAGIGIMSPDDARQWVRIGYNQEPKVFFDRSAKGVSRRSGEESYTDSSVYFKLSRREPLISAYFSADGDGWQPLEKDLVCSFPEIVKVYLYVYSTASEGVVARFSDFRVRSL